MRTLLLCLLTAAMIGAMGGCPDKKDSPSPSATQPTPARSDPAAASLEKAFAACDADAAAKLMDPRLEEQYRRNFQANKDAMPRVGKLLATRKLRMERGRLAEYEVTEDGKTFALTFELVDGQWRLMGL
ncbi:MAG: hypothetical protein NTV86_13565 [Planctomycetota bacterium]|nr:hypothetical protein [Planctomycetota bacterium]